MKKQTMKICGAVAGAFILFNLLVFALPFASTLVFWISYFFGLGAFALVGATVYFALIKNSDAQSRFYGMPVIRIAMIYGLIQTVACLLFMAIGKWVPWWAAFLVDVMGLAMAVLSLLSAKYVIDHVRTIDVQAEQETALIRSLQTKMSQLAAQSDHKQVRELSEEFRYCDPVSCDAASGTEVDLYALVEALQTAVNKEDDTLIENLCRRISSVLSERNRLCRQTKE